MRHALPLLGLLALAACNPGPTVAADPEVSARAVPQRLALNVAAASRRGGGLRNLAWEGSGRGCGGSVLDDPAAAQRLMAATFADGPRGVAMPVFACDPGFRPL